MYFEYTDKATEYLASRDPAMGQAILKIGKVNRTLIPDLFSGLVNAIISQQVSTKAAETVWRRMQTEMGIITPQGALAIGEDCLCEFGISKRKAGYILGVAKEIACGRLSMDSLMGMENDTVIETLCKLSGIGRWTAHMVLIFTMAREDVFPIDDFGIKKGMAAIHGVGELSANELEKYKSLYSPHGTVAALYVWGYFSSLKELQPGRQ